MKAGFCLLVCVVAPWSFLKSAAQQIKSNPAPVTVQVDMPPFLYEGDRLEVVAKVTNHSDSEQTKQLQLQLADAGTNTSVDGWFQNIFPVQYVTVDSGKTERVRFPIEVPYLFHKKLRWQIVITDRVLEEGLVTVLAAEDTTASKSAQANGLFAIRKQVFLKRTGQPPRPAIGDTTTIRVGDSLKIHLSLTAMRPVAQANITDLLAAAFSPVANRTTPGVSHRQNGNRITFLLPALHKGHTVFNYTVVATHAGTFWTGRATVQSQNYPRQAAHSRAAYIRIEE